MTKWNKLISSKKFDILLFQDYIEEKGINNVTSMELDRVLRLFGNEPFEHKNFCDAFDEVNLRRVKVRSVNFCLSVILIAAAVTYGMLEFYVIRLKDLFSLL